MAFLPNYFRLIDTKIVVGSSAISPLFSVATYILHQITLRLLNGVKLHPIPMSLNLFMFHLLWIFLNPLRPRLRYRRKSYYFHLYSLPENTLTLKLKWSNGGIPNKDIKRRSSSTSIELFRSCYLNAKAGSFTRLRLLNYSTEIIKQCSG